MGSRTLFPQLVEWFATNCSDSIASPKADRHTYLDFPTIVFCVPKSEFWRSGRLRVRFYRQTGFYSTGRTDSYWWPSDRAHCTLYS